MEEGTSEEMGLLSQGRGTGSLHWSGKGRDKKRGHAVGSIMFPKSC